MGNSKKNKKVRKYIPWGLHMVIVRLQGAEELDYDQACVRAATLIEEGKEKYKEAVNSEANRARFQSPTSSMRRRVGGRE